MPEHYEPDTGSKSKTYQSIAVYDGSDPAYFKNWHANVSRQIYCTYPFNGSVGPGVTNRELTLTETDIEPLLAIGWSYTPKPVYHWKARDKSCPTVYGFGGLRPIFRDLPLPF